LDVLKRKKKRVKNKAKKKKKKKKSEEDWFGCENLGKAEATLASNISEEKRASVAVDG